MGEKYFHADPTAGQALGNHTPENGDQGKSNELVIRYSKDTIFIIVNNYTQRIMRQQQKRKTWHDRRRGLTR